MLVRIIKCDTAADKVTWSQNQVTIQSYGGIENSTRPTNGKSRFLCTWSRRWQMLVFPVTHLKPFEGGIGCHSARTTNSACRDESAFLKARVTSNKRIFFVILPTVVKVSSLNLKHWLSFGMFTNITSQNDVKFNFKRSLLLNDFSSRGWVLKPAALFETRDRKKKCLLKSREPEIKFV